VLVAQPLIELLQGQGHEVAITARDHAQTLGLLERRGLPHHPIGAHGGTGRLGRGRALVARSASLVAFARRHGPFELALGHGSTDITIASALLGIPCATAFDYEFARLQHHLNCRLADVVVVPELIPPERLARYGAKGKLARYPGLKEEYYLAGFNPDPRALEELGVDAQRPLVVVRTPPEGALYHRFESALFPVLLVELERAGRERGVQTVVLARTAAQRSRLAGRPGLLLPERVVDAPSLVAYASLVISGGGTMNREAVALGTPVATTFQGRLGAVDEALVAEGRLRRLQSPAQLAELLAADLVAPSEADRRVRQRRDPQQLLDLFLRALEARPRRRRRSRIGM